jgi:hypothetical protein
MTSTAAAPVTEHDAIARTIQRYVDARSSTCTPDGDHVARAGRRPANVTAKSSAPTRIAV